MIFFGFADIQESLNLFGHGWKNNGCKMEHLETVEIWFFFWRATVLY
jgi:hypothetical protein